MTTLGHRVLASCNLKIQTQTGNTMFNNAIEVYAYRIASLIAMIALLNGTRRVNAKHLQVMSGLWHSATKTAGASASRRRGQRGGETAQVTMPSDFYGYTNGAIWNGALDTNSQTVDFDHGIGRPAIEITGGSCCTGGYGHRYPAVGNKIKEYMAVQNVTIPQEVFGSLMEIVARDIHTLVHKLGKGPVTDDKLKRVLNSNRFKIFV